MTITNSSTRLAALVAGVAVALALMGAVAVAPAQAAGLSASQVQAIVSLLASFGADSATISNVTAALNGQATTGTGSTGSTGAACPVLTRSLQLGSTGADVMSLQKFLNASANTRVAVSGAGSPGLESTYFGPATKAAVIKFQAANSVSAIGVVGPASRAAIAAVCGTTGSTGGTTGSTGGSTGALSGGEAQLRSFDLQSGDTLMQGDTNKEIAVAKFDVKSGDAQIQRVTVEMNPTLLATQANQHPWSYVDSLAVYDGNTKIGTVDASSKSAWDQVTDDSLHASTTDYYTIDIPVNDIVRQDNTIELSIRATAQNTIDNADTDQVFLLDIPDNGIRAVDSKGIQQYTGQTSDTVNFSFNTAANGKLTVRTDSSNPNAGVLVADDQNTSDTFNVLKFQLKNTDTADADINTLTFTTAAGVTAANNVIRKATLNLDGKNYDGTIASGTIKFSNLNASVNGNDSINGTLSVQLYSQSGHFTTSGEFVTFTLLAANVDAEGSQTGDASTVSGSANGNKQTIAVNAGINVAGSSMSGSQTYNTTDPTKSYGTFTLKFNVTASGDDVYVYKGVQDIASTSSTVTGTNGVAISTDLNASSTSAGVTVSMTSTADVDTNNTAFYIVHSGDTETFTATVTIDPTATGDYQVGVNAIRFSTTDDGNGLQTLDIDQAQSEFHTDSVNIRNS